MANYFHSSPWQEAAGVGQGIGDALTKLLIALPRIRQQAALQQQHAQLYGAQAGLYNAEAARASAQTEHLREQTTDIRRLRDTNAELVDSIKKALAPSGNEAAAGAIGGMMATTPGMPQRGMAAVEKLLPILGTNPALNPKLAEAIQTNTRAQMPVGVNQALVNTMTGAPTYQAGIRLGEGQNLYNPVTGTQDITGPEKTFSSQGLNMGSALPALLATPSLPEDSLLPPEQRSALAQFLKNRIMGTNVPSSALRFVRDPKTGRLVPGQ